MRSLALVFFSGLAISCSSAPSASEIVETSSAALVTGDCNTCTGDCLCTGNCNACTQNCNCGKNANACITNCTAGQNAAACTTNCNACHNNNVCKGSIMQDCAPGMTRCDPSSNGVDTCTLAGTWGTTVACVNQTCVGGACTGVCALGQAQCTSNTQLETCTTSGQWGAPTTCPGVCFGTSCAPGCLIGGTYYAPGATNPSNPGQYCNPSATTFAWTHFPATAIAPGHFTACALLSGGSVECWGAGFSGELGNGPTTVFSLQPLAVTGLSGVTAISTSYTSVCALLSGGTVECWGSNMAGALGNGSSTGPEMCGTSPCSTTPVAVSGLSSATAISARGSTACALLSGGTVECWGYCGGGQLGNGSSTGPEMCGTSPCSTTPVAVSGLIGATAISVGSWSSCALLSGGTVKCWGDNSFGELGNGSSTGPGACASGLPCSTTPVAVSGLSGATAISVGIQFACALSNGTVECWGNNSDGQLGNGSSTGPEICKGGPFAGIAATPCSTTPVAVSGLSGVTGIAVGNRSACALLSDGTVKCWGDNTYGELGNGTTTSSSTPVPVTGLSGVTAISVGDDYTVCALLSGGTVKCWGNNPDGILGNGDLSGPELCASFGYEFPCSTTPVAVKGL
jgi:alpha-tubulin suppressor-like RCC1 family protein